MGPKSRPAERRGRALGLNLAAIRSEMVVLKWCSPYYQTRSKAMSTDKTLAHGAWAVSICGSAGFSLLLKENLCHTST
jgi:hypothetical protein